MGLETCLGLSLSFCSLYFFLPLLFFLFPLLLPSTLLDSGRILYETNMAWHGVRGVLSRVPLRRTWGSSFGGVSSNAHPVSPMIQYLPETPREGIFLVVVWEGGSMLFKRFLERYIPCLIFRTTAKHEGGCARASSNGYADQN